MELSLEVSSGLVGSAVAEATLRPHERLSEAWARPLLDQVERRIRQRVDAKPAPSDVEWAVLAPGVGGVVVHELVGHALEADQALGGSWLARRQQPVAPPALTVLDDPRRCRAPWHFDDEGEAAQATALIRDGRVTGLLHDLATSRLARQPTTGHGRRAGFRDPARPRMGCTFVAAGLLKPEAVIGSFDRAIYVRRIESASTDPRTGRATFRVLDADLIINGRIDRPLEPHLMFIDGIQALASMNRVADDLSFDTCVGSCHRGGQTVPISVGAPTIGIRVDKVVARKKSA